VTGALIFEGLKALLSGIVCKAFLLKVKGKKKSKQHLLLFVVLLSRLLIKA